MTIQEALDEIRSKPKWYVKSNSGKIIPHSNLIQTAQRIEDGRAKTDTIKRFFEQFGYEVEINQIVRKV